MRGLRFLPIVLGLALAIGIVASLLAVAAPTPPTPRAGELVVDLPMTMWGLIFLSPLLVGVTVLAAQRILDRRSVSRISKVAFAVLLALAVLFVYVLVATHGSSSGTISYVSSPAPKNQTSPPPPHGGSGNSSPAPVPGTTIFKVTAWMGIAIALGLTGLVALLALPGVIGRVVGGAPRSPRSPPVDRARVREAVAEAGSAIDRGEDARETIVRLYVRLLGVLEPRFAGVPYLTAGEIRTAVLERLGVQPHAAHELTLLFEEARYSTHPMGPEAAGRCRAVFGIVQADLSRTRATAS